MGVAYNPRIVTNGLVLCLDAGNRRSYPGSGTTWYDLSGNGNNGSFVGSPAFRNQDNGIISFDAIEDYITVEPNSSLVFTSAITVSVWFKADVLENLRTLVMWEDDKNSNGIESIRLALNGASGIQLHAVIGVTGYFSGTSGSILTDKFYNATGVFDSSKIKIYLNGEFRNQNDAVGTLRQPDDVNARWIIGRGEVTVDDTARMFDGNISVVHIYNRVLTDDEINQNYHALKGRYV